MTTQLCTASEKDGGNSGGASRRESIESKCSTSRASSHVSGSESRVGIGTRSAYHKPRFDASYPVSLPDLWR